MSEEKVTAVLVAWHPATGRRRHGNGFLKTLETNEPLFLDERVIGTTGIESLRAGSYVRCRIGPADAGFTTRRALEVEIYTIDAASR